MGAEGDKNMEEVLMTQEQIKEIIPHRDPFLLIDDILELTPGEHVVARKTLKEDEFWFKGDVYKRQSMDMPPTVGMPWR